MLLLIFNFILTAVFWTQELDPNIVVVVVVVGVLVIAFSNY